MNGSGIEKRTYDLVKRKVRNEDTTYIWRKKL